MSSRLLLGVYKHYKGGSYYVMSVGKHTETLQRMVIYHSLKDPQIWIRPLNMFIGNTMWGGKLVKRFTYVSDPCGTVPRK